MMIKTIKPFIPSGEDFALAKAFFLALGCTVNWEVEGLAELQLGEAAFILQNYHNKELQENLMLQVSVADLDTFWADLQASKVLETFAGVRANPPKVMPWGNRELHLIDLAGVCWHFVA